MNYQDMNPFTPSFGRIPAHFAGRKNLIDSMSAAFGRSSFDPNLSTLIVGARGTGKTALLSKIAYEAQSNGWIVANVSAAEGMLEDILQRALEAASELIDSSPKSHVTGVNVGQILGIEWQYDETPQVNWRSKMNALLKELDKYETGLLITVDEVDPEIPEVAQLASVYQHFVREDRRVALVMAGLPYSVSSLLSNKSVSFLRRARQHHLGRIADADIKNAFRRTIEDAGKEIDAKALDAAVKAIDGFPYMMQLVGYRAWQASENRKTICLADALDGIASAEDEMRTGVLEATYRDLSAGDIRFLNAMLVDEGDSKLSDIAHRMGVASNYASQYRRRLAEQGLISERGGGYIGIDLPLFKSYLKSLV